MNRAGIHTKAVLGKKKKPTTLFHRPHTDFYVQFGAGKTLIIWNKFSRGPQALKLARGCSPCPVRRGWGNGTLFSLEKRKLWGHLTASPQHPWGG